MLKTKVITTIGPSSLKNEVLSFFKAHSVEFARLNFSHSSSDWHIEAGQKCREHGLKLLMDLGGPKIRLGVLNEEIKLDIGTELVLELTKESQSYPYKNKTGEVVLPVAVDLSNSLAPGREILVDDGKLKLEVVKIEGDQVHTKVITGGVFRSRKGVNLPKSSLSISFLTERDKQMVKDTLKSLMPEVVACSFVKSADDINVMKDYLAQVIAEDRIDPNYFPQICAKIEQHEVFDGTVLDDLVQACDMIMIARGDLALEITPAHLVLPFLQEKIERSCRKFGKPFVYATQVLESMISCPVPTRAEVSDLYRAVVLDKADYVMLSGESAMGDYPKECVEIMDGMITKAEGFNKEILGE